MFDYIPVLRIEALYRGPLSIRACRDDTSGNEHPRIRVVTTLATTLPGVTTFCITMSGGVCLERYRCACISACLSACLHAWLPACQHACMCKQIPVSLPLACTADPGTRCETS